MVLIGAVFELRLPILKSCIIFIAACFALWNPVLALGREFDGDEFSNDTLAYKLELLNHTFWRTEQELSSRGVVGLDQVRSAWIEKNHLRRNFCAVISILICSMSGSRSCAKNFARC